MSLYDRAYKATNRITSDTNGWGAAIVLSNLEGTSCNIKGTRSKHHLGVDSLGNSINTKNAHVTFHEKQVIDAGFNIRNSEGDVAIKGYRVDVADSSGTIGYYVIKEFFPSETTGLIVCTLGEIASPYGIGTVRIGYDFKIYG